MYIYLALRGRKVSVVCRTNIIVRPTRCIEDLKPFKLGQRLKNAMEFAPYDNHGRRRIKRYSCPLFICKILILLDIVALDP